MPTRLTALASLLCVIPAAALADGESESEAVRAPTADRVRPDWSVTLGGGAVAAPAYPGASEFRFLPLPLVDIRYRDRFFLSPFTGIGVNAVTTRRLQLGVAVLPDFGRSASAADRLRGWGDLGAGANLKVFGTYSVGRIGLLADVRRQLGAGNGTLVGTGLTTTLPIARHLILIPSLTATWANARYSRAYFGIDGNQSAAASAQGFALPAYSAGAGLRDTALTIFAMVPLDEHWSVQSLVRAEVLLNNAASPVVTQRVQPTVGGFLAYKL